MKLYSSKNIFTFVPTMSFSRQLENDVKGYINEDSRGGVSYVIYIIIGILVCLFFLFCYKFYQGRQKFQKWASKPPSQMLSLPHFWTVELASILCGVYALTVTFSYLGTLHVFGGVRNPLTTYISDCGTTDIEKCPTGLAGVYKYTSFLYKYGFTSKKITVVRQVVAYNDLQMVLLGISRFSGFSLYPWIIMVFFTKLRATYAFLSRTPIGEFLIQDTHELHVFAGWYIFFDSMVHTVCHCLRWADQGNINLLWSSPFNSNPSGISGLLVFIAGFIIVVPMTFLKKRIKYEIRKYAHYFFWIFALAMCWHAPFNGLPNCGYCRIVFPIIMISYFLDTAYVKFFMTERIDTVTYRVLNSGVELTMPVSKRFEDHLASGGYGYVMFPWVARGQWHAFSIYENALDSSIRHMFMANIGDWTKDVHKLVANSETARPLWIQGPFPSPYSNALSFDNIVCVASGIGITPAISAIEAYRDKRRVNLIWACRDPSMLIFFLENAKLDDNAFNLVFYTGKAPLPDEIHNYNVSAQAHLKIIKKRPNLSHVIPNIIRVIDEACDDGHNLIPRYTTVMKEATVAPPVSKETKTKFEETLIPEDSAVDAFSSDRSINIKDIEGKATEGNGHTSGHTSTSDIPQGSQVNFKTPDPTPTARKSTMTAVKTSRGSVMVERTNISEFAFEKYNQPFAERASTVRFSTAVDHKPMKKSIMPRASTFKTTADVEKGGNKRMSTFENLVGQNVEDEHLDVWKEREGTIEYVKKMKKRNKDQWGFLYCGGINPLLSALVAESKELGVPLHQEAFNW